MSGFTGLTRRLFLTHIGALAGTLWLPACRPSAEVRQMGELFASVLTRSDQWQLVGRRYLEGTPAERRLKTLVLGVRETLSWNPSSDTVDLLGRRLAAAVRQIGRAHV